MTVVYPFYLNVRLALEQYCLTRNQFIQYLVYWRQMNTGLEYKNVENCDKPSWKPPDIEVITSTEINI